MANVINDNISATYGGANLNEIFFEPTFRSDDILANYRVIPNVKHTMNVFTSSNLTKIVNKYTTCSVESGSVQSNLNDKVLTAGRLRVALEQCSDEFFDSYIEELYRSGVDVMNAEGTVVGDIMMKRTVDGIGQDVVRLAWGADSASASAAYDQFDGWFKLAASEVALETVAVSTDAPTAAEALSLIRGLYDGAPAALQQVAASEKKIFVTPKLLNAYLANLEGTSSDLAWSAQADGVQKIMFRGVELVPMYEWDTILGDINPAIFNGGTTPMNATQGACYVAKDNLVIGTDVSDPTAQIKMWYDDKDEKTYVRSYFKMGVQYLHSSLIKFAIVVAD